MKLNKKLLLFAVLLICSSRNTYATGNSLKDMLLNNLKVNFIASEVTNDITTFITKKGVICRAMKLAGFVWAANVATKLINEHIVSMSDRTKNIVRGGLLATAYVGTKLQNFNK
jgi:hypothetical protein